MTGWKVATIEANGITIHYHRIGGATPALILLHGVTDSGPCWMRVARDLEGEYDVIMPDARGHGGSSGIESGFSVDILADDVAALIGALKLDRPFLYGHSMGAVTAASVAARYPEQVRAVVLEDPPLIASTPPDPAGEKGDRSPPPATEWIAALKAQTRDERIAQAAADNPAWVEDELLPWVESKEEVSLDVANHFDVFRSYPWRRVLSSITCPILLITGDPERGAIVTPDVAREAEGLSQHGQVAHIPGAGHSVHRDRYKETMAAVRSFLAAHRD